MSKKIAKETKVSKFLYEEIEEQVKNRSLILKDIPNYLLSNLSPKFNMRDYQEEAFRYFITYIDTPTLHNNNQTHLLFHMATGSGKTYIMAGAILHLYKKGYRNFLFFVNDKNIIEKTKANFLDKYYSKYLFNEKILIDGNEIEIKEVDKFTKRNDNSINIKFTSVQKLHKDINNAKENSITIKDFEDNNVVLIADEAHHINSDTKNNSTEEEIKNNKSWEKTIKSILNANKENVLLEFTATCELKNKAVLEKYKDKIIFNYYLLKFRDDGYTKEFYNSASNYDTLDRTIRAMLLSQYRLELFKKYGYDVKPVILLKSFRIEKSKEFYDEFTNYMQTQFSSIDIDKFKKEKNNIIEKMYEFFKEENIKSEDLVRALKSDFKKENLIFMNDDEIDSSYKQIVVNDLENKNNKYRMIFTVDKLTEGWDVLNLFDIVRLYENNNTESNSTTKEAQLIGRGARYFPFEWNHPDDKYKRKFDIDLEHELRICETLYYHSKNNSKYIQELQKALQEQGFEPKDKPREFEYKVKEEFTKKDIFENGKLFVNDYKEKSKELIHSIPTNINLDTSIDLSTSITKDINLMEDIIKKSNKNHSYTNTIKVKEIDRRIILKALRKSRITFNKIKIYLPNLKGIDQFILDDNYIGRFELTIRTDTKTPTNIDIYKGLIKMFENISIDIKKIKHREGTKEFIAKDLKEYVKDTPRKKLKVDDEGEGISQNADKVNSDYKLDLSDKEWFVYNDNYGTTEEKKFVAYFATKVEELKQTYEEVYLIRNERNLHIYSFEDGARFEPDYILLLKRKGNSQVEQQQIFIEPKGAHLLKQDKWKEEFLLQLEANAKIEEYSNEEYRIIGLPFYNKYERLDNFNEAFEALV